MKFIDFLEFYVLQLWNAFENSPGNPPIEYPMLYNSYDNRSIGDGVYEVMYLLHV